MLIYLNTKSGLLKIFLIGIIQIIHFYPNPGFSQVNKNLLITKTLNSKGHTSESLAYFEKNIPNPTNELLIEKGNALFLKGDIKSAANFYFEANNNNPQLANYELARCYATMNQPDLAIKYLTLHLKSKNRNMQSQIKSDKAFAGIDNTPEWKELWNFDWYSKYDLMYEDAWYEHSIGNDNEALAILNKLTEIRK